MRRSEAKFRAIYAHCADRHRPARRATAALIDVQRRTAGRCWAGVQKLPASFVSEFVPPELGAAVDDFMRSAGETPQRREFPVARPDGRPVIWSGAYPRTSNSGSTWRSRSTFPNG
jgi:hypothetical protein